MTANSDAGIYAFPQDLMNDDQGHYILFDIFSEEAASLGGSSRSVSSPGQSSIDSVRNERAQGRPRTGAGSTRAEDSNADAITRRRQSAREGGLGGAGSSIANYASETVSNTRMSKAYKRNEDSVILPMPQNLTISDGWNWEMTSFKRTLAGEALGAVTEGDSALAAQAVNKVGGAIGNFVTENADKLFQAQNRTAFNPRKEALFSEPNSRNITLEYDFAPRNQGESEALRDIIGLFKVHAAPKRIEGSTTLMAYPSEFLLTFSGTQGENQFVAKFGRCALKSIQTSYTNAGVASFHKGTDAPTHQKITLEFGELELLDRDHYKDGY
jgi:hypothetical protein